MGRAILCKRDRIVLCNTHGGGRSCQERALIDRICSSVKRLAPALGIDHLRMPVDSYKPGYGARTENAYQGRKSTEFGVCQAVVMKTSQAASVVNPDQLLSLQRPSPILPDLPRVSAFSSFQVSPMRR